MGRIPKKAIENLIRHAKADINFGWHGSYGGGNEENKNGGIQTSEVKKAKRAIEFLESLIAPKENT